MRDGAVRFPGMPRLKLARHGADFLAIGLVFLAYTATLWTAHGQSLGSALVGGVANTVPVVIFGVIARHLIVTRLMGRSAPIQLVGHAIVGVGFAVLSYWLLLVLLGLVNGQSPTEFSVRAFPIEGTAWQMLEEATTYAVLAALTYAQFGRGPASAVRATPIGPQAELPARAAEPARYFTRIGEDLRPIDLDRLVCIGGADDYAEVTTLDGNHLVRMTLSEFEQALDPTRFARVHRSWIVNLDRVERAEPAGGGRMLLHMQTGQAVPASRAGARSLRNRVI